MRSLQSVRRYRREAPKSRLRRCGIRNEELQHFKLVEGAMRSIAPTLPPNAPADVDGMAVGLGQVLTDPHLGALAGSHSHRRASDNDAGAAYRTCKREWHG